MKKNPFKKVVDKSKASNNDKNKGMFAAWILKNKKK